MLLGDRLANAAPGIPAGHLVTTGHSLGGGLASAAAVVGDIPADTFNAAGLHLDTLYLPDINGDPIPDGQGGYVERYLGSVARYNNSAAFISAFYSEFDLLSAVQDYTPIPNALGYRIQLDSLFDLEMIVNGATIGAAIGLGHGWSVVFAALDGALTMVESHGHPTLLYGLLVIEDWFGGFELDVLGYDAYFD